MIIAFEILSIVVLIAGLVGAVIPILPGLPLAFFGALIFAWITKFQIITPLGLVALAGLAIVSLLVDYFSGLISSRYAGASWLGALGALLGSIIGLIFFGLPGIILGPAIGVLIFEIIARRPAKTATKIAGGTLLGSVISIITGGILALIFLIIFLAALIIK